MQCGEREREKKRERERDLILSMSRLTIKTCTHAIYICIFFQEIQKIHEVLSIDSHTALKRVCNECFTKV